MLVSQRVECRKSILNAKSASEAVYEARADELNRDGFAGVHDLRWVLSFRILESY
jgi:hypothetical protein